MSKRNRFAGTPAIVFSLAILLLALGHVGDAISRHWERVHQANAAYQKNAENDRDKSADEIAKRCKDLPEIQFRECIRKDLEAHYRDQATNEDLQAQQDMAFWAFWLLIASVIGVVISGFGVLLLIRSIGLGREANREATKAANAANEANVIMRREGRPWVTVVREDRCNFFDRGQFQGEICWNYNLVNKGKSPAYDVKTHMKVEKHVSLYDFFGGLDRFAAECVAKHSVGDQKILFPNETTDFIPFNSFHVNAYQLSKNGKDVVEGDYFVAFFCITYNLTTEDKSEVGCEARVFIIEDQSEFIGPWRHKMLEHSRERIVK